jgi:hypothetical protein
MDFKLSPRENLLRAYNHEKTEYVPFILTDTAMFGFGAGSGPWLEKGPPGGGIDGFGVKWVTPMSGGGAPIPAPNEFILDDITKWKEKITLPDVNAYNWEKDAAQDLAACDRSRVVVDYGCGNGVFERLGALMGFENACIAMAEEPEAVNDLFTAITDYKIAFAEKAAQYYKPDCFTNYDDIATDRELFIGVVLTIVGGLIAGGAVDWKNFPVEALVSIGVGFIVGTALPVGKWGAALAGKAAKPGTFLFKLIINTFLIVIMLLFMCPIMTLFTGSVIQGAPVAALLPNLYSLAIPFFFIALVVVMLAGDFVTKLAIKCAGAPETDRKEAS